MDFLKSYYLLFILGKNFSTAFLMLSSKIFVLDYGTLFNNWLRN